MKILVKAISVYLVLGASMALADEVDTNSITTFQAGTPALASEVNANFSALIAPINDNANRITALEAAPELSDGAVTTDKIAAGAVSAAKLGLANTIYIEDSGSPSTNCGNLRLKLNGLVGPAAILLGPGTWLCGTVPVVIPAAVSLIGSGENLTRITGNTPSAGQVILAGDNIALERLTVDNTNFIPGGDSVAIQIGTDTTSSRDWRIEAVTASALQRADTNQSTAVALRAGFDCGRARMTAVTAEASGGDSNHGFFVDCNSGVVSGTDLRSSVGAPFGTGISVISGVVTVRDSELEGAPRSVSVSGGTLKAISSELAGTVSGLVFCMGDYDGLTRPLTAGFLSSGGCRIL